MLDNFDGECFILAVLFLCVGVCLCVCVIVFVSCMYASKFCVFIWLFFFLCRWICSALAFFQSNKYQVIRVNHYIEDGILCLSLNYSNLSSRANIFLVYHFILFQFISFYILSFLHFMHCILLGNSCAY